jgi:hypothetical protein
VHFHFTPTHSSWLNQIEFWFSILRPSALQGASFTSVETLIKAIEAFISKWNQNEFGQFPASQVPYAYFLVGVTTLSAVTYGVTDPADVWQIGLNVSENHFLVG